MSQNDLDLGNITFPAFRTELNLQLLAISSLQSHATDSTEPPTTVANMLWYDTGAAVLKIRNAANDGWIEICDVNQASSVIELSSKLKAPNGTASAPSVTFDSDTDTGIYRKTTNTLGISAGGSEKLTVSSTGISAATGTVTTLTSTTANITTVDLGNWTITESSGTLYFATGGTNKMKLDASGNLTVVGDVTAYGTI